MERRLWWADNGDVGSVIQQTEVTNWFVIKDLKFIHPSCWTSSSAHSLVDLNLFSIRAKGQSSPPSLWYRSMHILITHHVNNWWTDIFLLPYTPSLMLPVTSTPSLCHTLPLTHIHHRQLFPFQSQTAIGSLSTLPIFHVSLFPAESITSAILSHEQTGLSVSASKHFNFFGLFFLSLGSALDETVVYVYVFCVCFWTVNVCWRSADGLNVLFSATF